MASGSLASLVVNLEANIASFTRDMSRASQQTEQAMGRINGALDTVKAGMAALGVGVGIGGLAMMVKASIDAADSLRDMSQMTGVAVENLNGLGFAAGQAGGSLESIASAAGKLNKSVAEAAGGNKETSAAFKALSIDIEDASGKLKTADVIIAEVADRFQNYADGPEKSALALRLFGKAGADMIPMLNDGGDALRENMEYAKQYSGATTQLSNAADNFNDTMGKLTVQQKGFSNAIASGALPVMQAVAESFLAAGEKANGFSLAGEAVRTVLETFVVVGSEVAFTFKAVGTEIGGIAAQLTALATGDFEGFRFIGDAMKRDAEAARKEHDAFIARVLDRTPAVAAGDAPADPTKPSAPRLPGKGDDPGKSLLDGKLKELDAGYAKERDTASFHEKFMRELRAQDIVDLQTYQAFKTASIEQGLASAIRAYDAQIAVLERARADAAKATERAEIDNKIKDKQTLKERARFDAMQAGAMQTLELSAAQSELNNVTKEWAIQQGQAASQFQFEIDMMGKSQIEVAKLTAARRIYLDVEEQIRRAQKNSAVPIDRTAFDQQRDTAIAASNSLYDQADTKQRDPWFNMQESIRRYGEEANNVGASIGNSMRDAFQGAEDAFVEFTTTGRLSFSGLATSILADIARIMARKAIAGLANMAVSAFSMGSSPSSGPGSTGWDGYGNTLAGARANGGPVSGGSSYLVGERGPEIFTPRNGGTIIPNHAIGGAGGGITINTEVNVANGGATSQASGDASSSGRALSEMVSSMVKDVVVREMRQGGAIWTHMNGRA